MYLECTESELRVNSYIYTPARGQVVAAEDKTCAIGVGGLEGWVKCWGLGSYHSLGDGRAMWHTELPANCTGVVQPAGAISCLLWPPEKPVDLGANVHPVQVGHHRNNVNITWCLRVLLCQ